MAGAGKTSVGKLLSSRLNFSFIDSDKVIEKHYGKSLQKILEKEGKHIFQKIEQDTILSTKFNKTILSTGGSVILLPVAMEYIKQNSKIIYIEVPYEKISERVNDFSQRGFIKRTDQSTKEAYLERMVLYQKYADHIVSNNDSMDECVNVILEDVLEG